MSLRSLPCQAGPAVKVSRPGAKKVSTIAMIAAVGAGIMAAAVVAGPAPAAAQFQSGGQNGAITATAPASFADLVARVKPAVVSIHVTNGGKNVLSGGKGGGLPNLPKDHPLNEFFKKNFPRGFKGAPRRKRPTLAQGSGFFISRDGYVVTNNHVIDGASKILVSQDGREKLEAELIGTDPRTDIALLKVKEKRDFPFVRFAAKKNIRAGDWVVAVGNPFGLGGTVTAGIVSAMGRDIGSGPYDYIQIDAAVNKGNSGGPTFNLAGDVIGVNTAIYSPSGGNVGIAFAVPARTAAAVVEQLKSNGSVKRGWLGVKIQNIDEDAAAGLGLPEARGALVSELTPGGPASRSELRPRDAIIGVDGVAVADSRDLARKIAAIAPNKRVELEVVRDGSQRTIMVKLGTFPTTSKQLANIQRGKPVSENVTVSDLGLTLGGDAKGKNADIKEGVRIADVDPGSNAAEKGLKEGDVIVGAGSFKVKSAADVKRAVKAAKKKGRNAVLLAVRPSGSSSTRFVGVRFADNKG